MPFAVPDLVLRPLSNVRFHPFTRLEIPKASAETLTKDMRKLAKVYSIFTYPLCL